MRSAWLAHRRHQERRDLSAPPLRLGDFNLFANLHHVFTNDVHLPALVRQQHPVLGRRLGRLDVPVHRHRLRLRQVPLQGKEKLFGLVLGGVLVPTTVIQLPMYPARHQGRRREHLLALLLPPWSTRSASTSPASSPRDTYQRGAGGGSLDEPASWRTFAVISLPMLAPFMTIFLFSFTPAGTTSSAPS